MDWLTQNPEDCSSSSSQPEHRKRNSSSQTHLMRDRQLLACLTKKMTNLSQYTNNSSNRNIFVLPLNIIPSKQILLQIYRLTLVADTQAQKIFQMNSLYLKGTQAMVASLYSPKTTSLDSTDLRCIT